MKNPIDYHTHITTFVFVKHTYGIANVSGSSSVETPRQSGKMLGPNVFPLPPWHGSTVPSLERSTPPLSHPPFSSDEPPRMVSQTIYRTTRRCWKGPPLALTVVKNGSAVVCMWKSCDRSAPGTELWIYAFALLRGRRTILLPLLCNLGVLVDGTQGRGPFIQIRKFLCLLEH